MICEMPSVHSGRHHSTADGFFTLFCRPHGSHRTDRWPPVLSHALYFNTCQLSTFATHSIRYLRCLVTSMVTTTAQLTDSALCKPHRGHRTDRCALLLLHAVHPKTTQVGSLLVCVMQYVLCNRCHISQEPLGFAGLTGLTGLSS